MSITGTPAKIGNEWGGVRVKEQANPGDIVTVTTKAGKTWQKRLVSPVQNYPDAVVWSAEDVEGNGAGGPAGPAQSSAGPAPSGVTAGHGSPAPASNGRVTLSEYITVCKLAYSDFVGSNIPAEQAGSMATSVAIQFARGAENDLDPFSG